MSSIEAFVSLNDGCNLGCHNILLFLFCASAISNFIFLLRGMRQVQHTV